MSKNIVICCDGTGNQVSGDLTNVLKLYRCVRKDEVQRAFYDPGIGTIGDSNPWRQRWNRVKGVFGLATGAGLDDNILDAYRFLVEHYQPGDRLYFFGFSRGAYTVRALAGLIHAIGVLHPDQANLAPYALTAYKRAGEEGRFDIAWDFARITGSARATIHFMGVWDTVASMIVPRRDRFYLPSLGTLPFTRTNPSVRAFRHAMAIDERRRMFRLNHWNGDTRFVIDPFSKPPQTEPQDCQQVWFAGAHADVGGGYSESESGLSKFPLIWMAQEALDHGLQLDHGMLDHLTLGTPVAGGRRQYVAADVSGMLHRSLKGAWWVIEFLPKNIRWREWPKRSGLFGYYLPMGEPRAIAADALIHPSVQERIAALPAYRPPNVADAM